MVYNKERLIIETIYVVNKKIKKSPLFIIKSGLYCRVYNNFVDIENNYL